MLIDTSNTILSSLKRINLVSGKGGTGRTTLAASMARASAKEGKKTLLIEIEDDSGWDSALARNFGLKHFQVEPELLEEGLYGLCLSAPVGQEKFLTSFLKLQSLSQMVLGNQGIKWFLEGAPAFREMGYFYHLLLQLRSDFDRIILDLPATGHFIGLARLPNLILKMIPFGPIADRMREGQKYFYDAEQTSVFIVTLPQTLPVSEAIELKSVLARESLPLGGYILNRAPYNPFTEAEEQMLLGLSQKSKTQKLMVELERIRRFREAKERLSEDLAAQGTGPGLWVAPEVIHPEEELHFGYRIQTQGC
jgi:anion-transporting  ArsA/GET3 family ATPase